MKECRQQGFVRSAAVCGSVSEDKVAVHGFLRLRPYFLHRTLWKNVVDSISTLVAVPAVNGRSRVRYGLFTLHRLLFRAVSTSSRLERSKNAKNVAMLKLPYCADSSDLVTGNVSIFLLQTGRRRPSPVHQRIFSLSSALVWQILLKMFEKCMIFLAILASFFTWKMHHGWSARLYCSREQFPIPVTQSIISMGIQCGCHYAD